MNAYVAMSRAQLSGRAGGLLAAFAAGWVPVVAALVSPGIAALGPSMVVPTWVVTQIVALFIGMSLYGEDLMNGRLSFFFARPVSAVGIWLTRLATGLLLALAIEALMLAPLLIYWLTSWSPVGMQMGSWSFSLTAAQYAIVCSLIVSGGAVVAIVGRDRTSGVGLLDGACAIAFTAGVIVAGRTVMATTAHVHAAVRAFLHAPRPIRWHLVDVERAYDQRVDTLVWVAVALAVLAFVATSGAALLVGRTSPRRAHRAASLALWSFALPGIALFLGYIFWFLAPF